jgi:hypothetical protein
MRKTAQYKVEEKGRDQGKVFLLTEMTARQGEEWAMKVLLALMASNVNLPEGFENLGMAALAQMGLKALTGLKWEVLEPLLSEMMQNIEIIPDPAKTHVHRPLIEDDIEEILTRLKLRAEVWNLNMGFLAAVAPSLLGKKPAAGKR